tara:strand:- start:324 stop:548 length:225 start_codon:yes stop_codon:yes gene_type:complete
MDDFETLQRKKLELEEKKMNLEIELYSIEEELMLCTNKVYNKCVEGGGHYLHREYDYQLYGEVTLICVNCGYTK